MKVNEMQVCVEYNMLKGIDKEKHISIDSWRRARWKKKKDNNNRDNNKIQHIFAHVHPPIGA